MNRNTFQDPHFTRSTNAFPAGGWCIDTFSMQGLENGATRGNVNRSIPPRQSNGEATCPFRIVNLLKIFKMHLLRCQARSRLSEGGQHRFWAAAIKMSRRWTRANHAP